ncbi:MAG: type II toxin-antitoxin system RelE/ParE family toxin [Burkholderiaceae bacterium]|nr:type II toxin-antitoxin system RelE/ParE family toxin [Burkholderiaceae bacterium]
MRGRAAIYDHIEADNPAAALAMDELLAENAARLLDHPRLGRPGRVAGTRELVAHQNTPKWRRPINSGCLSPSDGASATRGSDHDR